MAERSVDGKRFGKRGDGSETGRGETNDREEERNGVFVHGGGRSGAYVGLEFEIGILNSRHFCFDVSRLVIRSVGGLSAAGHEEVIFSF